MALTLVPMIIPSWSDGVGGSRDSFWMLQSAPFTIPTVLQNLVAAAAACSAGGNVGMVLQIPLGVGGVSAGGPYNCGDAAAFYLTSSSGTFGVICIPDPLVSIFKTDGVTVDLTNSNVVSFLSYVMSHLGDTAGNAWSSVRMANRIRFPG